MTSSILGCNSQDQNQSHQQSSQLFQIQHHLNHQTLFTRHFQFHNDLCHLSMLLDNNNRAFIELLDLDQRLDEKLRKVKRIYEERKARQQKNETIRKKILQETMDKNIFEIELYLFGCKQYKYQLILAQTFEKNLYKERNFDISIKLVDSKQKYLVLNQNLLPITLNAYCSDGSFTPIFENKIGLPVFKGNCEGELHNGFYKFEKLQFRQVTSIYSKKWIYFVIYTKPSCFNSIKNNKLTNQQVLHNQVRPLIISEIIVKSKKK